MSDTEQGKLMEIMGHDNTAMQVARIFGEAHKVNINEILDDAGFQGLPHHLKAGPRCIRFWQQMWQRQDWKPHRDCRFAVYPLPVMRSFQVGLRVKLLEERRTYNPRCSWARTTCPNLDRR